MCFHFNSPYDHVILIRTGKTSLAPIPNGVKTKQRWEDGFILSALKSGSVIAWSSSRNSWQQSRAGSRDWVNVCSSVWLLFAITYVWLQLQLHMQHESSTWQHLQLGLCQKRITLKIVLILAASLVLFWCRWVICSRPEVCVVLASEEVLGYSSNWNCKSSAWAHLFLRDRGFSLWPVEQDLPGMVTAFCLMVFSLL